MMGVAAAERRERTARRRFGGEPGRALRRRGLILLVAVLAAAGRAGPPSVSLLSTNDTALMAAALDGLNMTLSDLGFAKDIGRPRWAPEWIRATLEDPLRLPDTAGRIRAAVTAEAGAVWRLSVDLLEAAGPEPAASPPTASGFAASHALTPHLAGYLDEFVDRAAVARQALDRSLAAVPPAERRAAAASVLGGLLLIEDYPDRADALIAAGMTAEDVRRVLAEAVELDPEPAVSNLLDAVLGVDVADLARGGELLQAAAARLAGQAQSVRDWPAAPVVIDTAYGRIVVGTTGADRYDEAALLILDPGGDDRYAGAAGVGNGLTEAPVAVIVDLDGNDTYTGTDLFGPGSALFGLAVLLDPGGHDAHRSALAGQGAAVCGAAWVEDGGGDDTYRGGVFCQGAAVGGIAALNDAAGNDVYEVGLAGQAYAGVRGAGWLVDRAGDDRYLAGNRERDRERHSDRFLSLAQGFSIGLRPFAGGGVAVLADLDGNDTYAADVYGQGVSYWYSAGFLLDGAGNDTYRMFHYGQGSGIHLSLGLLSDEAGDDTYTGAILAQGNAHDYAVGMLIDRAGNDTYTADTYSQGRGLYNALGLLFDGGGDDAYWARQADECQGLGHDGAPREYGCLGLLIDAAGRDRYVCGVAEAGLLLRPWYGVVCDGDPAVPADGMTVAGWRTANPVPEGRRRGTRATGRADDTERPVAAAPPSGEAPAAEGGDEGTAGLDWAALSIEQVLVLAQHPGNSPARRRIRSLAERELLARGPAALEGLMRHAHLENTTLQLRTQQLVESLPGTGAVAVLAAFLGDVRPRTRRLAAYHLGLQDRPRDEAAIAGVRRLLEDDEAAGAAIRTLGKWRDRESLPRIAAWLGDGREPRRVAAANALRELGDPAAVPALIRALGDPVFTVRTTAQRALIALGRPAERAALREWRTADPAVRRQLLGVLAAGDSWAARRRVRAAARDPDPAVRRAAAVVWSERN